MTGLRFGGLIAALVGALICVPGALSAPPSNDDFAAAAYLFGETGTYDSSTEATKQPGEPDHAGSPGGASVWFRWIAPRDGQLLIDTCDSAIDTLLAVFTGTAVDDLDEVMRNDDSCGNKSAVEFAVVRDDEVWIAVDGKEGATGAIELWWGMRPGNDDFANASSLSGWDTRVYGGNWLATHEPDELLHAGAEGSGSLWFEWTAPGAGTVEFDTCDSNFDTVLAVYRGTTHAGLESVAGNDDACDLGSAVQFDVTEGSSYRIVVDGFGAGDYGYFYLRVGEARLRPAPLVPPSIKGVPRAGETLTGELGTWRGTPQITFEFWWERQLATGWAIWSNTIGSRTLLASMGEPLRFAVRASNPVGQATAYSDPVVIAGIAPANVALPEISGVPRVGHMASLVSRGEWTGTGPLNYSYQWERCEVGLKNCVFPSTGGPAARSYVLTRAEVGYVVRVLVNVSGPGGFASTRSAPIGPVVWIRRPQRASCRVPRLTGKTLRAARRSLAQARCRLGEVRRVRSGRKRGLIVRQSPRPDARLRVGGKVTVFVSLGRRR